MPNLKQKKYRIYLISVFATIIGLIGIILILRTSNLNLNILSGPELDEQVSLETNAPLQLPTRSIAGEFDTSNQIFGQNLESSHLNSLENANNLYFEVSNLDGEDKILKLNDNFEMSVLYKLPGRAENVKIYNDESITYTSEEGLFDDVTFWAIKDELVYHQIQFTSDESKLVDYFFDSNEKVFYFLTVDRNGVYELSLRYPNGNQIPIYRVTDFSFKNFINIYDSKIYFYDLSNNCLSLGVIDKQILVEKCSFVNFNESSYNINEILGQNLIELINTNDFGVRQLELSGISNINFFADSIFYLSTTSEENNLIQEFYQYNFENDVKVRLVEDSEIGDFRKIFFWKDQIIKINDSDAIDLKFQIFTSTQIDSFGNQNSWQNIGIEGLALSEKIINITLLNSEPKVIEVE